MVLENPLWQQANTYPARLDRQFIEDVFDVEGVIKPAGGALLVSPRAAGANMSVDIAAGRAVVKGDDEANQGSYRCISTAVENRPISPPPGADSRIDLVVARVRDANVTGGVSSDWVIEVIPGAVAPVPVAPAVPATAIPLAQVLVAAGTLSIDLAKITDRRTAATNAAYAPKASPSFTGTVVSAGAIQQRGLGSALNWYAGGPSIVGTAVPSADSGQVVLESGSSVSTVDSFGNAQISFSFPFPNGVRSVIAAPGDSGSDAATAVQMGVIASTVTLTDFFVHVRNATGGLLAAATSVRVNWIAVGH